MLDKVFILHLNEYLEQSPYFYDTKESDIGNAIQTIKDFIPFEVLAYYPNDYQAFILSIIDNLKHYPTLEEAYNVSLMPIILEKFQADGYKLQDSTKNWTVLKKGE